MILRIVFSWRSEYIQKYQPSPLSAGTVIIEPARRDGPLLGSGTLSPIPPLGAWGFLVHLKSNALAQRQFPPRYSLMWNLGSWHRAGHKDGKSPPKPDAKGFLLWRSAFDSEQTNMLVPGARLSLPPPPSRGSPQTVPEWWWKKGCCPLSRQSGFLFHT